MRELDRLAEFRRAFDDSFAVAQGERTDVMQDILAIRIGSDRFALRVNELTGLHEPRHIVPLPGTSAELLGLAGIRGRLVPVFSLPVLLGYSNEHDAAPWLVLCNRDQELALSFGGFTGHMRVVPGQICALSDGASREHLREVVRTDSGALAIVSVPSIVSAIQRRMDSGASPAGAKA